MAKLRVLSVLVFVGACAHQAPSQPQPLPAPAAPPATALTKPFPVVPTANPLLAEVISAEQAAAQRPDDAEAWRQLGRVLVRANRLQEAARAVWRTVELAPSAESWTALGNLLVQGGAPGGAMAAFEEVSQQTNDGFLVAQNFISLGYRAWQWGMDDLAMRAYARAEELAPGHPQILHHRTLLLAVAGQVGPARAEATKLRAVVDRVLQDLPPLEMVEILEPMKALAESVLKGDAQARRPPQPESGQRLPERFWRRDPSQSSALALAIDPTAERFFPIADWRMLVLTLPSGWTDSLTVRKGQPAQIRLEAQSVYWTWTVTQPKQPAELDRLIAEERLHWSGTLGEVRSLSGPGWQGRSFISDEHGNASQARIHIALLRVGDFLIAATRFLPSRDPGLVEQTEGILRSMQLRDLTPPQR